MNIAIIDAEIAGNHKNRFPNLACMKISAFHKQQGDKVTLVENYDDLESYDKVYLSSVFSDVATQIPSNVLQHSNVVYGGTGFYYDKYDHAPTLNMIHPTVEHMRPDYSLYDSWVQKQQSNENKKNKSDLKYYTDFSIGFLSRGCSRRCEFCVNRHSSRAEPWSSVEEFLDPSGKRNNLCLLDDNVFAMNKQQSIRIIESAIKKCESLGSKLQFKQGLDIRLMNEDYAKLMATAKYCGDYIFAFDNLNDKSKIEQGLSVFRKHVPDASVKMYTFCGYKDLDERDVATVFERLSILWRYQAIAYVMRHANYKKAEPLYRDMYTQLARWCNQPNFQKTVSFRIFCNKSGGSAAMCVAEFQKKHPDLADKYFDMMYPTSKLKNSTDICKWADKHFVTPLSDTSLEAFLVK